MRTAAEIYESNVQYERNDVSDMLKQSILSAIMTAQIEAIKECADLVSDKNDETNYNKIISLIDQIK